MGREMCWVALLGRVLMQAGQRTERRTVVHGLFVAEGYPRRSVGVSCGVSSSKRRKQAAGVDVFVPREYDLRATRFS